MVEEETRLPGSAREFRLWQSARRIKATVYPPPQRGPVRRAPRRGPQPGSGPRPGAHRSPAPALTLTSKASWSSSVSGPGLTNNTH